MPTAINDDDIIAEGLAIIREGIETKNTKLVCQGYNIISGEELLWEDTKPNSRLEQIRAKLAKVPPAIAIESPSVSYDQMTVKEIQSLLKKQGSKTKDFKGKKKADLIKLIEAKKAEVDNDVENVEINLAGSRVQKGGQKFGKGTIEIISDKYDPTIAKANEKLLANRIRIPKKERSHMPQDNSDDENATFRFHNTNIPPNRR